METMLVKKHNMRRFFFLDKIGLLDGDNILVQTKDPKNARCLTLFQDEDPLITAARKENDRKLSDIEKRQDELADV